MTEIASWARIMAPVAGGDADGPLLAAAALIAAPFGAELAAVYAPADVADLMPWMGEGFMGGVQVTAVQSLKEAAAEGERAARAALEACAYGKKAFTALVSPVNAMAIPEKVDVVWIRQNYHDLYDPFMGPANVPAFNKLVFNALKKGGLYVIIDH